MAPEVDRAVTGPEEPSLAEMTVKAIDLLKDDPEGFFLMVEGSQIDWGGHQMDIANVLHDHVAFDAAVQAALDFARADGNTLVIVAPDHNCGGLSIGNLATYDALPLSEDDILGPVRALTTTAMYVWEELGIEDDPTVATVQKAVKEAWGADFSVEQAEEVLMIAERDPRDEDYDGLGEVYARDFTHIGWTGHEHTAGDVPLYAFGPGAPGGLIAAPDLGRAVASALGVDLAAATDRLFAPAEEVLAGMAVTIDSANPDEVVLRASAPGKEVVWPMNRNAFTLNGETVTVEGPAVFIDRNGRAWLPRAAAVALGLTDAPLPAITLAAN
jgi:alkaline phosphatase